MGGAASILERVAQRYARALYRVAHKEKANDALRRDFAYMNHVFAAMPSLARFIANPTKSSFERGAAMALVLRHHKGHAVTLRLVEILTKRARLPLFVAIGEAFAVLCDEAANKIEVVVRTAHPLSDAREGDLIKILEKSLGKNVSLKKIVDERLLGGLMLDVEGRLYDASLATRLQRMAQSLSLKEAG